MATYAKSVRFVGSTGDPNPTSGVVVHAVDVQGKKGTHPCITLEISQGERRQLDLYGPLMDKLLDKLGRESMETAQLVGMRLSFGWKLNPTTGKNERFLA